MSREQRRGEKLSSASVSKLITSKKPPSIEEWNTRVCSNLYSESETLKMISEYIMDIIGAGTFKQDTLFIYTRLIIGTIACLFATFASVVVSFVNQKMLLGICAGMFFFCMFLLYLMEVFMVHGAPVTFFDRKGTRHFLDISLDRTSSAVSFRMRCGDPKKFPTSTYSVYLGRLFYADGRLATDEVFTTLTKLYAAFSSGKHGTISVVDEGYQEALKETKQMKSD